MSKELSRRITALVLCICLVLPNFALAESAENASTELMILNAISESVASESVNEPVAEVSVISAETETVTAPEVNAVSPKKVVIEQGSKATVNLGETLQLTTKFSPENAAASLKWTTSSKKVAVVDEYGLVTPMKAGKATIKVTTANKKTDKITVTVVDPTVPAKVVLAESGTVKMDISETLQLHASVSPDTAQTELKWSSSSKKIATVDQNGFVTPQKTGTVTITVRTENGKTDTVKVKVTDKTLPTKVELDQSKTVTMAVGQKLQLNAAIAPETAVSILRWSSSSKSRATVDEDGVVTAKKTGTVTITVKTRNGKKDTVKVKIVKEIAPTGITLSHSGIIPMVAGQKLQLSAMQSPSNATGNIAWASSDKGIATVDNKGLVTAKGEGFAIIMAETSNGKIATCTISVTQSAAPVGEFEYKIENEKAIITKYNGDDSAIVVPEKLDGYAVAKIGEGAFSGNAVLQSIVLPDDLKGIGDKAFANCVNLKTVIIPSDATVGTDAFKNCVKAMVYAECGSPAYVYCQQNGIDCKASGNPTTAPTVAPTAKPIATATPIPTATSMPTPAPTSTATITATPTAASTATLAPTPSVTPAATPVSTATPAATSTAPAVEDSKFTYAVEDGKCTITGYTGTETSVVIPDTINGYPVTAISNYAFSGCSLLEAVEIPDSVTAIGEGAFENCIRLGSIVIPKNVTSLGARAFLNCEQLTRVEINGSLTAIETGTFKNCSLLESVTIPDSVTIIGDEAFAYCSTLPKIEIPASVTSIGKDAFKCCYALKDVAIPEGVTDLGSGAFFMCFELASIEIPGSVKVIEQETFAECHGLKTVVVSEGVTQILAENFWHLNNLTSISLPASLTYIADYAIDPSGIEITAPEGSYAYQWLQEQTTVNPSGISIRCDNASPAVGEYGFWEVTIDGIAEPCTYKYELYRNGEKITTTAFSSDTWVCKFDKEGEYYVVVTAKDNDNNFHTQQSKTVTVQVKPAEFTVEWSKENPQTSDVVNWEVWPSETMIDNGYEFRYALQLQYDGKTVFEDDLTEHREYRFLKSGEYTLTVTLTDQYGNDTVQTIPFTVAHKSLALVSCSADTNDVELSARDMQYKVSVTGGEAPYTFVTNVYRNGEICHEATETIDKLAINMPFEFAEEGNYQFKTVVTDATGESVEAISGIHSVTHPGLKIVKFTSNATSTTLTDGDEINFSIQVDGGVAPYTIGHTEYLNGEAFDGGDSGFEATNAFTYDYRVHSYWSNETIDTVTQYRFKITDSVGDVVEVYSDEYTVLPKTVAVSSVSTDKDIFRLGESITWSAAAVEGWKPLSIAFDIYKDDQLIDGTPFVVSDVDDYDKWNSSFTYTPDSAGTYKVKARARDSKGNTAELFSEEISSYVAPSAVLRYIGNEKRVGELLTWETVTENGYGSISYAYELYKDDVLLQSVTIKDGTIFTYLPNEAGSYMLKVTVTDEMGSTVPVKSEAIAVVGTDANRKGDFGYSINGRWNSEDQYEYYVEINAYWGSSETVIVPESIDGYPVTSVRFTGNGKNESAIRTLILPASLEQLNSHGFSGCTNLTSVNMAACTKLTEIPERAFMNRNNLQAVILPDTVKKIWHNAFWDCDLRSVQLPDSVTSIEVQAFGFNDNLTSINIPTALEFIGYYAFEGCEKLIFENLSAESVLALVGKARFTSASAPGVVWKYDGYNDSTGEWYDNVLTAVGYVGHDENVIIPLLVDSVPVVAIAGSAFEACTFSNIQLPSTIKYIGRDAFLNCDHLTEINIPFVDIINTAAFQDCDSLTTVYLQEGFTSVPFLMFGDCNKLEEVRFPSTVTKIRDYAFINCYALREIALPDNITYIASNAFYKPAQMVFKCDPDSVTATTIRNNGWLVAGDIVNTMGLELRLCQDEAGEPYYSVVKYTGTDKNPIVPAVVDEISIKAIETGAFQNSDLESVTLPDGLTSVARNAFYHSYYNDMKVYCKVGTETAYALEPERFGFIDPSQPDYALHQMKDDNSYPYLVIAGYLGNEKDVVVPATIGGIAVEAIYEIQGNEIESIYLPDGVRVIAEYAFYGNDELTSIRLPDTLVHIGHEAFNGCNKLVFNCRLDTPIGRLLARSTAQIVSPSAPDFLLRGGNAALAYPEDVVYVSIAGYLGTATDIVIPSQVDGVPVTGIRSEAFYDQSSIVSVEIPDSVEWIGAYAFENCSSLESIVIPKGVQSIEYKTFNNCSSMKSITIPDSVDWISDYAFQNCSSLRSIVIPDGVEHIWTGTFDGCSSLRSVSLPEGLRQIDSYAFRDCSSLTSIRLPASLERLGGMGSDGEMSGVFSGCSSLQEIVIPSGIEYIDAKTFYNCSSLTNVVLPQSVTSIGAYAFYNCRSLKSINLSDVTSIGNYAFSNCDGLTSMELPSGLENLGTGVFENCDNIEKIVVPDSYTRIYDEFRYCTGLKTIVLPKTLRSIGYGAFEGCTSLEEIEIPDYVSHIGNKAFKNCVSLKSIVIPDYSVKWIERETFMGCTSLTSVTLPKGLRGIDSGAFRNCRSLTSINFPNTLTYLGGMGSDGEDSYVFAGCSSLKQITIPNSITYVASYMFKDCYNLTSVTLSSETTSIGNGAFFNCTALSDINIPQKVRYIGEKAFYNCDSLKSIKVPEGVVHLSKQVFYDCDGLTSVQLSKNLTDIEEYAFYGCSALESIGVPSSVKYIGPYAFDKCGSPETFTVIVAKDSYSHDYCVDNGIGFTLQ